ncbi:MAG: hypothetical protein ACYCZB_08835 [Acidiphilium sp.]
MEESSLNLPPAGFVSVLRRMVALRESQAEELRNAVQLRDERIEQLDLFLRSRNERVAELDAKCHELAAVIERLDRWVIERDRRIKTLEAIVAVAGNGDAAEAFISPSDGASRDSAILRRLVLTLEWPNGPRALRAVLPLARLIRRIMRR